MKTMICVILDRSGSMAGREKAVIKGVNTFLDEQKLLPQPATIAFVRFDNGGTERFRPMQRLRDAQHLTSSDFQPRSGTPLYDAVGRTIVALDDDWKRDQPDRCIVVIITDGQENSSREYTPQAVAELVLARKWSILLLGANVDSFAEATAMGIPVANTANYHNTARGLKAAYTTLSTSVARMRATGDTLADNLGGDINEDGSLTNTRSEPTTGTAASWKA